MGLGRRGRRIKVRRDTHAPYVHTSSTSFQTPKLLFLIGTPALVEMTEDPSPF